MVRKHHSLRLNGALSSIWFTFTLIRIWMGRDRVRASHSSRTHWSRGRRTENIIMIMLDCMRTHELGLSKSCLLLMRWWQQPRIWSKIENFQLGMTRLMRTHSKRNIIARKQTAFTRLKQQARAPPLVVAVAVYCLHIRRFAVCIASESKVLLFF